MMSSLTDQNFQTAIEALLNRDSELCNRVIVDDEEVDILAKTIDQDGVNLLLRFQSNWENLQKWLREALETKTPWQSDRSI